MQITRETTVKEALESSPGAPEVFARLGIDPSEKCSGMYDMVTLEDAVEWCKLTAESELETLIAELNACLVQA